MYLHKSFFLKQISEKQLPVWTQQPRCAFSFFSEKGHGIPEGAKPGQLAWRHPEGAVAQQEARWVRRRPQRKLIEGQAFIPKQVIRPVPPLPACWLRLEHQRADGETEAQGPLPPCPAAPFPFHPTLSGTQTEVCFLPRTTVAF